MYAGHRDEANAGKGAGEHEKTSQTGTVTQARAGRAEARNQHAEVESEKEIPGHRGLDVHRERPQPQQGPQQRGAPAQQEQTNDRQTDPSGLGRPAPNAGKRFAGKVRQPGILAVVTRRGGELCDLEFAGSHSYETWKLIRSVVVP